MASDRGRDGTDDEAGDEQLPVNSDESEDLEAPAPSLRPPLGLRADADGVVLLLDDGDVGKADEALEPELATCKSIVQEPSHPTLLPTVMGRPGEAKKVIVVETLEEPFRRSPSILSAAVAVASHLQNRLCGQCQSSATSSRPSSTDSARGVGLGGLPASLAGAATAAGVTPVTDYQDPSTSDSTIWTRRFFLMKMPSMESLLSAGSSVRRAAPSQSSGGRSSGGRSTRSSGDSAAAIGRFAAMGSNTRTFLAERVREGSMSGMPQNVVDLVSFGGCEELLRGSRLSTILNGQARIFVSSAGSAATFRLSRPVKRIDQFVSHNWCIPRYKKFFSLALYFNFTFSTSVTLLLGACLGLATGLGWVPMLQADGFHWPKGFFCRTFLIPTFLIVMFFGSEMRSFFGYFGPTVFLDKTCIHQEDKEMQRKGIEKLGAFLCHSERMVILYTDYYLRKLWTVYEVASFLALHPLEQVTVIPSAVPLVILTGLLCSWLAVATSIPLESLSEFYNGPVLTTFLLAPLLGRSLRGLARSRAHIGARLENFRVSDCLCFNEEDRPLVYKNIAALMIETQGLSSETPIEEALTVFEGLVRDELPGALKASIGTVALQYKYLLLLSCSATLPSLLDSAIGFRLGGVDRLRAANLLLWHATAAVSIYPLILVVYAEACGLFLTLRGWREWAVIIGVTILLFLPIWAVAFAVDAVKVWTNESMSATICFLTLFLVSSCVTAVLVRGCRHKVKHYSGASGGSWAALSRDLSGLTRRTSSMLSRATQEEFN